MSIKPVLWSTDFDQASEKLRAPNLSHVLPIELKLYADTTPTTIRAPNAGIIPFTESVNAAMPEGKDRTPAPSIVFPRLNIDDDMPDVPGCEVTFAKEDCWSTISRLLSLRWPPFDGISEATNINEG